jgi:hypothetical protein
LLGLSGTQLTLGIHDALRAPNAGVGRTARPGFVVAVNAPAASIKEERLWIRSGRLYEGPNPIAATEFKSNDMMLFELHRGPSRAPNWATLPSLAQHSANFDTALRETSTAELAGKINGLFRKFEVELDGIDDLTDPDKAAIRAIVAGELKRRVEVIRGGGLIEEKSVEGPAAQIDPRSFHPVDFADIPEGAKLPSRPEGLSVSQPASPGTTVFSGPFRKTPAFPRLFGPKPNRRRSLLRVFGRERACGLHSRIGGSVWGVRLRLNEAEQPLLCCPRDRKVHGPDQTMGGQFGGLPSGGDRLDDLRGQEGERQQAADVPIADSFDRREFGDTADLSRDERLEAAMHRSARCRRADSSRRRCPAPGRRAATRC